LAILATGSAFAAPIPAYVVHAVKDEARPSADAATDAARDPSDTLALAGVKPGMTVAELFPGGGYYSRMLSNVVGPSGHVYGIENAGWKAAVKLDQAMAAEPGGANFTLQVQPFGQFALPTKVDPVWIT
jgi:predicted methyltransferase